MCLIGHARVEHGGKAILGLGGPKSVGLLTYLALRLGKSSTREQVLDALWPGVEEDAARNRLSTALVGLRKALTLPDGTCALVASRTHLSLDSNLVDVDFDQSQQALSRAESSSDGSARLGAMRSLFATTEGGLAPELYEDWIVPYQIHYSEWRDRLTRLLVEEQIAAGELDDAKSTITDYEKGDSDAETLRVLRIMLSEALERTPQAVSGRGKRALVGRDFDLLALAERVRFAGRSRVVQVIGFGGVGKSSLVATYCAEQQPNALILELAGVYDRESLLRELGAKIGLRTDSNAVDLVRAELGRESRFVVLDTFEHLPVDCDALVAELFTGLDNVTVLVTSRRRLRLPKSEPLYLRALETHLSDSQSLPPAQEVFLSAMRKGMPWYVPSDKDLRSVNVLVESLGGNPLALELAAQRVRLTSLEEAVAYACKRESSQRGGDLFGDVVFETYELLPTASRTAWRRMAFFEAEVPEEAIALLADELGQSAVLDLHDFGLFTRPEGGVGGYRLYDIYREELRLRMSAAERQEGKSWFCSFWKGALFQRSDEVRCCSNPDTFAWLDRHNRNLVAYLLEAPFEDFAYFMWCMRYYWPVRSRLPEAIAMLRQREGEAELAQPEARAQFWYTKGSFEGNLGNGYLRSSGIERAHQLVDSCEDLELKINVAAQRAIHDSQVGPDTVLQLAREGDTRSRALAESILGTYAWFSGNMAATCQHHERALQLAKTCGDLALWADSCRSLAYSHLRTGKLLSARNLLHSRQQVVNRFTGKSELSNAMHGLVLAYLGRTVQGAEEIDADVRYLHGLGLSHNRSWRARIHLHENEPEKALEILMQAKDIAASANHVETDVELACQLAETAYALGMNHEAACFIMEAQDGIASGETLSSKGLNAFDALYGRWLFEHGNSMGALNSFSSLFHRAVPRTERLDAIEAFELVAQLYSEVDPELGRACVTCATDLRRSTGYVMSPFVSESLRPLASRWSVLWHSRVEEHDIDALLEKLGGTREGWKNLFMLPPESNPSQRELSLPSYPTPP